MLEAGELLSACFSASAEARSPSAREAFRPVVLPTLEVLPEAFRCWSRAYSRCERLSWSAPVGDEILAFSTSSWRSTMGEHGSTRRPPRTLESNGARYAGLFLRKSRRQIREGAWLAQFRLLAVSFGKFGIGRAPPRASRKRCQRRQPFTRLVVRARCTSTRSTARDVR